MTTTGAPENEGNEKEKEEETIEILSTSTPSPQQKNTSENEEEVLEAENEEEQEKTKDEAETPETEDEQEKQKKVVEDEEQKKQAAEKAKLVSQQKNYAPEGEGQRQRAKLKKTGTDLKTALKSAATPPKFSDKGEEALGEMIAWLMMLLLGAATLPALAGAKALYHKGMAGREDSILNKVSPQLDRMEKLMEKRDKLEGQIEKLKKEFTKGGETDLALKQKIEEKEAKLASINKGIAAYQTGVEGLLTDKMKSAKMAKEGAEEKLKDIAASKKIKEEAKEKADDWVNDVETRMEANKQALEEARENKEPQEVIAALEQEGKDLKEELTEAKELQKNATDELNSITKLEKATLAELEEAEKDISKREDQAQRLGTGTEPGGLSLEDTKPEPEPELESETPEAEGEEPSEPTPEDLTKAAGILLAEKQVLEGLKTSTDEKAKTQAKESYEKMLGEFVDYKGGLSTENQDALMDNLKKMEEAAKVTTLVSDVTQAEQNKKDVGFQATKVGERSAVTSSFMQRMKQPQPLPPSAVENKEVNYDDVKKYFEDNKELLGITVESGRSGFLNDYLKIQKDNPPLSMSVQKQQGGGVAFGIELKSNMSAVDKEKSIQEFCNLAVGSTPDVKPGAKFDISGAPQDMKPLFEKYMNQAINQRFGNMPEGERPQVVGGGKPKQDKETQRLG